MCSLVVQGWQQLGFVPLYAGAPKLQFATKYEEEIPVRCIEMPVGRRACGHRFAL